MSRRATEDKHITPPIIVITSTRRNRQPTKGRVLMRVCRPFSYFPPQPALWDTHTRTHTPLPTLFRKRQLRARTTTSALSRSPPASSSDHSPFTSRHT